MSPFPPQILAARGSTPSPLYSSFMARLTDTVRDDIADCAAASYATLTLVAAQSMFKFDSMQELAAYLTTKRVRRGARHLFSFQPTPAFFGRARLKFGLSPSCDYHPGTAFVTPSIVLCVSPSTAAAAAAARLEGEGRPH